MGLMKIRVVMDVVYRAEESLAPALRAQLETLGYFAYAEGMIDGIQKSELESFNVSSEVIPVSDYLYKVDFGQGYVWSGTQQLGVDHFCDECGYTKEDQRKAHHMKVGEVLDFSEGTCTLTVTRIQ